MLILTEHNQTQNLNLIPDQVDSYFWVFDNSPGCKDYFCVPLVMLESFYSPTIRLRLTENSGHKNPKKWFLNVPADYQILIGEPSHGDMEINTVTSLSGRHFHAYTMNPLTGFRPEYLHIEVEEVLPSIKWFMPKMKVGQLLCVPIDSKPKSPCIYLVRDIPKSLEIVRLSDAG